MRALEQLVAPRRRVVGDKVRMTNRLTGTLKNYFPHVLQWFEDKDTLLCCDFLAHWPTLKAAHLACALFPAPPHPLRRRHHSPHCGHQERCGPNHRTMNPSISRRSNAVAHPCFRTSRIKPAKELKKP